MSSGRQRYRRHLQKNLPAEPNSGQTAGPEITNHENGCSLGLLFGSKRDLQVGHICLEDHGRAWSSSHLAGPYQVPSSRPPSPVSGLGEASVGLPVPPVPDSETRQRCPHLNPTLHPFQPQSTYLRWGWDGAGFLGSSPC